MTGPLPPAPAGEPAPRPAKSAPAAAPGRAWRGPGLVGIGAAGLMVVAGVWALAGPAAAGLTAAAGVGGVAARRWLTRHRGANGRQRQATVATQRRAGGGARLSPRGGRSPVRVGPSVGGRPGPGGGVRRTGGGGRAAGGAGRGGLLGRLGGHGRAVGGSGSSHAGSAAGRPAGVAGRSVGRLGRMLGRGGKAAAAGPAPHARPGGLRRFLPGAGRRAAGGAPGGRGAGRAAGSSSPAAGGRMARSGRPTSSGGMRRFLPSGRRGGGSSGGGPAGAGSRKGLVSRPAAASRAAGKAATRLGVAGLVAGGSRRARALGQRIHLPKRGGKTPATTTPPTGLEAAGGEVPDAAGRRAAAAARLAIPPLDREGREWVARILQGRLDRLDRDFPDRPVGQPAASEPARTPTRSRRSELTEALFGPNGEYGITPGPYPVLPPPSAGRVRWEQRMNAHHERGSSMSEIDSMRDGWAPHVGRARQATDDMVASLQQWAAAIEEAPVHPSVHEAAQAVVALAAQLPDKVAAVNALTQQADRASWDHTEAVQGRPNPQAWI